MNALGRLAALALGALVVAAPAVAMKFGTTLDRARDHVTRPPPTPPADRLPPGLAKRVMDNIAPIPPVNLHATTDVAECGRHGAVFAGGIACTAVLGKGQLVLVWDWKGGKKIDGYRVYQSGSGVIGTQSGQPITMFIVPRPAGGYGSACYQVTAYSGGKESKRSSASCAGNAKLVQTVTLRPDHRFSAGEFVHYQTGLRSTLHGSTLVDRKEFPAFTVGYNYDTHQVPEDSDFATNEVFRAALHFDMTTLMDKTIRKATLKLTVDTTHHWMKDDNHYSCISRIGTGVAYWWNHTDHLIEASQSLSPGEQEGPDVAYDVTSLARSWQHTDQQNFGMVLMGNDENLNAFTEKACKTQYEPDSAKLVVEYQD